MQLEKLKQQRRRALAKRFAPVFVLGIIILIVAVLLVVRNVKGGRDKDKAEADRIMPISETISEEDMALLVSPTPKEDVPKEVYSASSTDDTRTPGEEIVSQYAIFIDMDNDIILSERNAYDRINPASMTKVLTALVAAEHLSELPRNLLLVFQPSEETTGGARLLCETGVLQKYRVRRIFAFHLWPGLPEGTVWSRPGPLMARSSEVTVSLTGKSVHISKYNQGVDAMTAGAEYLTRAYSMMEQLPPEGPSLLRFGKMTSGEVRNAISGQTRLEGSLRTYSEKMFRFCRQQLQDIGKSLAAETGCAVSVHLSDGYPAVWNHEELFAGVCAGLGDSAPALLDQPALAAEDFSFYQQEVPGVMFFLGVGDSAPLHSPAFAFDDEAILPRGVEFLKKLALLK